MEYLRKDIVTWSTPEEVFSFGCKTISCETFTEELEGKDIADYTVTLGTKTLFYVSKLWHEGSPLFKKSNLNLKYVPRSDKATEKVTYFLAQSYIPSTSSEQKRILSYLDVQKKKVNWEAVCNNLKSLAISSGYSSDDIKQSLLSCIRLTQLNETLYEDLDSDHIARELIRSVRPVDKQQVLWASLWNLERAVNTSLQQVLAAADGLISKIFNKPGQQRQNQNLELQALCFFTTETLAREISDDIKLRREAGQEVNFHYYRQHALRLEQKRHVP